MFVGLIILAVFAIYFYNQNNKNVNQRAIEILDKKLIDGEISEDEYLNKKYLIER
ncbi:MAG: hypothetical protein JG776_1418 [Caloramator sp.]|jgi:uncharacterized membrane protein|uniref:hypothetical protein n=1 Tax=Caloramator sp. TaxID=1871330 RepID=UPI001DC34B22|nr:hypothetical protein [Caloramator sp.]MBZ4663703.1 hypothetical protein [Caloramator sp.]